MGPAASEPFDVERRGLDAACALGLKASATDTCGTVQWIRDAVVATTVRVGVENAGRVGNVPSSPTVLGGAAGGSWDAHLQPSSDE